MASGIALGMNYLHTASSRPLIHADLKMKNVLVSDGFKPKVSDVMACGSIVSCESLMFLGLPSGPLQIFKEPFGIARC